MRGTSAVTPPKNEDRMRPGQFVSSRRHRASAGVPHWQPQACPVRLWPAPACPAPGGSPLPPGVSFAGVWPAESNPRGSDRKVWTRSPCEGQPGAGCGVGAASGGGGAPPVSAPRSVSPRASWRARATRFRPSAPLSSPRFLTVLRNLKGLF